MWGPSSSGGAAGAALAGMGGSPWGPSGASLTTTGGTPPPVLFKPMEDDGSANCDCSGLVGSPADGTPCTSGGGTTSHGKWVAQGGKCHWTYRCNPGRCECYLRGGSAHSLVEIGANEKGCDAANKFDCRPEGDSPTECTYSDGKCHCKVQCYYSVVVEDDDNGHLECTDAGEWRTAAEQPDCDDYSSADYTEETGPGVDPCPTLPVGVDPRKSLERDPRENCKIEVGARHFGQWGDLDSAGKGFHHLFLLLTDTDGSQYAVHGEPNGNQSAACKANPYGCIHFKISATDGVTANKSVLSPVTVAEGPSACDAWGCISRTMGRILDANIAYHPTGPNSNSVAHSLVSACGMTFTYPWGALPPGWDIIIP